MAIAPVLSPALLVREQPAQNGQVQAFPQIGPEARIRPQTPPALEARRLEAERRAEGEGGQVPAPDRLALENLRPALGVPVLRRPSPLPTEPAEPFRAPAQEEVRERLQNIQNAERPLENITAQNLRPALGTPVLVRPNPPARLVLQAFQEVRQETPFVPPGENPATLATNVVRLSLIQAAGHANPGAAVINPADLPRNDLVRAVEQAQAVRRPAEAEPTRPRLPAPPPVREVREFQRVAELPPLPRPLRIDLAA